MTELSGQTSLTTRGVIRWLIRETLGVVVVAVSLFLPAGRLDWGMGWALVAWAMAANAFFSLVVRIQSERGQTVASSGPYRYVRHPGYSGTIVFELATPILLGSLWALIPGVLAALLFLVRTALEDRTLQTELDGYNEYAGQVRYRLVPGVW